jgi:hypothetical protein
MVFYVFITNLMEETKPHISHTMADVQKRLHARAFLTFAASHAILCTPSASLS